MLQSSKDAITHAVRQFKKEVKINSSIDSASIPTLSLELLSIDTGKLNIHEKVEVCQIMLELMEIQYMLPGYLKNSLWEMRVLVRKYKSVYFGKGGYHG